MRCGEPDRRAPVSIPTSRERVVGHKEGHSIMTKIKSFTVGLPVTELSGLSSGIASCWEK